jgi:precorrin-6Y C5,15-methyltransferase (decarboxylating)
VKKLYFVGAGMGNPGTLTAEGREAVCSAELLIGAPRLLEAFPELGCQKLPLISAEEIEAAIRANGDKKITLLFSGDLGFYSGAERLYGTLGDYEIIAIPGISALSYLAARVKVAWQDVRCVSAHGREADCAGYVQSSRKTFILTGGKTGPEDICAELTARGLGSVTVHIGERLSYPDERIVSGSAERLSKLSFDELAALLVINPAPIKRAYEAPFIGDEDFIRSKTPMTKEETRALCVSKLRLRREQVLWDVGAGTGSVSVECALALSRGRVFAVEKSAEALETLRRNREKFGACNMEIIGGSAPEALAGLPAPDRVFIGGASGRLYETMKAALDKNASVRFVIAAVTLETLTEALKSVSELRLSEPEVVQLGVSKAVKTGGRRLMTARNSVWLISCEGGGDEA